MPGSPEIPVEFCERRVEQLAARNDNYIDSPGRGEHLGVSEQFTNEPLCAVPPDSVPELFRRDDPEAWRWTTMWSKEQGEVSGPDAVAALEDLLKFAAPSNALRLREGVRRHARARLRARNSQALAPLGAAALEDQPAVLGSHPRQEAVSLLTVTAVGLKSALHVWSPDGRKRAEET